MKKLAKIMIGLAVIALIGLMIVGEAKNFNYGVCVRCETTYEAVDVTRHGQTVYVCPNCHHKAYN